MKVYQIMYDGDAWEAIDRNIYLQEEDAISALTQFRWDRAEDARENNRPDDSMKFQIVDFDLIGSWIDV